LKGNLNYKEESTNKIDKKSDLGLSILSSIKIELKGLVELRGYKKTGGYSAVK